ARRKRRHRRRTGATLSRDGLRLRDGPAHRRRPPAHAALVRAHRPRGDAADPRSVSVLPGRAHTLLKIVRDLPRALEALRNRLRERDERVDLARVLAIDDGDAGRAQSLGVRVALVA